MEFHRKGKHLPTWEQCELCRYKRMKRNGATEISLKKMEVRWWPIFYDYVSKITDQSGNKKFPISPFMPNRELVSSMDNYAAKYITTNIGVDYTKIRVPLTCRIKFNRQAFIDSHGWLMDEDDKYFKLPHDLAEVPVIICLLHEWAHYAYSCAGLARSYANVKDIMTPTLNDDYWPGNLENEYAAILLSHRILYDTEAGKKYTERPEVQALLNIDEFFSILNYWNEFNSDVNFNNEISAICIYLKKRPLYDEDDPDAWCDWADYLYPDFWDDWPEVLYNSVRESFDILEEYCDNHYAPWFIIP